MKKIYITLLACFCMAIGLQAQKTTETFESGAPVDWTIEEPWTIGTQFEVATPSFNPGPKGTYIAFNDDLLQGGTTNHSGSIIFSADLTTVSNARVAFESYFPDLDYQGVNETAKVEVSTDDGVTWTTLVSLASSQGEWSNESVELADYVGGVVLVRFIYDDGAQWNYGWALDNITLILPVMRDVQMTSFDIYRYVKNNEVNNITGVITNLGEEEITSMDVVWSDGTAEYSQTLTGLSIGTFEDYTFNHETPIETTTPTEFTVDVWATNPNGLEDMDMNDNASATYKVSTVNGDFQKRMVAEEGTGTWCTWCPRGDVFMNQMAADYPETFIGIAVHNTNPNATPDPMTLDEYDSAVGDFPIGGYPGVIVDRVYVDDPSNLPDLIASRLAVVSPVNVSGTAQYVADDNKINISLTSDFYGPVTDRQFTVSAVIVEDGVTGTTPGYAQVNAYSGGTYGPMGGYENLPNPVPAEQMVYNHVARAILGGWDGVAGDIPAAVDDGQSYDATFSIDLNPEWDVDNLHVALIVTDDATGFIHNGAEIDIEILPAGTEKPEVLINSNLFPNPAKGSTQLTFNLEELKDINITIYNTLGQNVWQKAYGEMVGNQSLDLDISTLSTGSYTLTVQVGVNDFVSKQFQVVE